MVKPARKYTVEERAAYMNDQARLDRGASLVDQNQKQLKREGISRLEARKRNRTNDDDDISVLSATDRPKELQGHTEFDGSPHWQARKHQRQRKKPTAIYVPENNIDSPALSIDSPLTRTRRTLVSSSEDYVGTRVCFQHSGIFFYGTVTPCFLNK